MDRLDKDIELMFRFQNGEEHCFEELVERHKQRVFNIAYRYAANVHDAEEIAQQVFINIYNAKQKYKPTAQFTTWLYQICKNTCLKSFRKKKLKIISIHSNTDFERYVLSHQALNSKAINPRDITLNNELNMIIKEAVRSLPDKQRIVLVLRIDEDLSYENISEVTGFSIKAVKSLLHRARIGLKDKLKDYLTK